MRRRATWTGTPCRARACHPHRPTPPHLTGGGTAAQIASMAFAHDLSPVEEAPALELMASPTPATPSNGTFGSVSFEAPDTSAHLEQLDLGLESEPPVCNSAPKCISPPPAGTELVAPRPPSPAFAQGGAEEGAEEAEHEDATDWASLGDEPEPPNASVSMDPGPQTPRGSAASETGGVDGEENEDPLQVFNSPHSLQSRTRESGSLLVASTAAFKHAAAWPPGSGGQAVTVARRGPCQGPCSWGNW